MRHRERKNAEGRKEKNKGNVKKTIKARKKTERSVKKKKNTESYTVSNLVSL